MTRPRSKSRTTRLATARLELRNDRRLTRVLQLAAVTGLVVLLLLLGGQRFLDSRRSDGQLAGLRQANATLQADLARARTELKLERSTRAALARQVADLNEEKIQLESRLDFIDAQSGRTGRTR